MNPTLRSAVATFGAAATAKLTNPAAAGEPEDQLRAPLEGLVADLAELCGLPRSAVAAVGESAVAEFKTRPDYAITLRGTLVGLHRDQGPRQGRRPAAVPRSARQGAVGKAAIPPQSPLYRRQRVQSLAQRGAGRRRSCASTATWRRRAPTWTPRPACWACSRISSAGSRSRRATPGSWPRRAPGSAACCARKSPSSSRLEARPSPRSPPTGASCSSPTPPTPSSRTVTRRPSRSACSWRGRGKSLSATASTASPGNSARRTR